MCKFGKDGKVNMQRVRLGMTGKILERVSKVEKDDARGLECWEG